MTATTTTTAPTATATTAPTTAATTAGSGTAGRRPVWRVGLVATLVASAATTAVAAAGNAAGVSLDIQGEPIPLLGFAQLTAFFSLFGVALAAVLARRARRARTVFIGTTVVLTALSLVPDVMVAADVSTKMLLMATHLVAAAIVIPAIASRLSR